MMIRSRPFRVSVPEETLNRIWKKLELSRIGYHPSGSDPWEHGTSAEYLSEFVAYWRDSYDWREAERRINAYPQYLVELDGIDVHYYHIRSTRPNAPVIVLTHGWPGSFLEFFEVIDKLAFPEQFGGDPENGFDLVIPSLPGYAFSSRPDKPIGPQFVASLWKQLLVDVLGYSSFFAQGGDWGAAVTSWLASEYPDEVAAIHLNFYLGPAQYLENEDGATRAWREQLAAVQSRESAYALEHATFPQTIGLALHDSPLGFAAWVLEKFHRWGDTDDDIESAFDRDALIANIMLYLVNDAVISSIWMYCGAAQEPPRYASFIDVPCGLALFPGEFLPIAPRNTLERVMNIKRWTEMTRGGAFRGPGATR